MPGIGYRWRGGPPLSIEDYRRAARRALPDMAWAYVDGAADDQVTRRDNELAFRRWRLRQRGLAGVRAPDLSVEVAGERLALPIVLAPTGIIGMAHWQGDLAAARAAEKAGTRHILSTGSSYSLEEVRDATSENHWFQLYPFGDRVKVGELLDRAAGAGFTALFVTVDVPVRGNREAERRAGMTVPPTLTPGRLLDVAVHPAWWFNLLRHKRISAVHYAEGARTLSGAVEAVRKQERYMQTDLDWNDLAWMRERWKGRLYVKGLMDPEDAARAVDVIGANGVVVSNHGGRQLDRAPATLEVLPGIVERVGNRGEVLLDGGVRRGVDVVTALALGARAVLIGRPYAYGLAAGGEAGVTDVLRILREEMTRALILMGCPSAAELDGSWLLAGMGEA
ncbi:alpha-hydroxy acid oxidase [Phenylobacterium sp.]|uniref:alpha-hydroxy acid oxidase n=1 Tax=Phenylobacterium sp. TaxID=1871053 RepID=UPI002F40C544